MTNEERTKLSEGRLQGHTKGWNDCLDLVLKILKGKSKQLIQEKIERMK